jgi:hypothetical protein
VDELPIVRFLFPCDSAILDLADDKWSIKNPWHTVRIPRGIVRNFGQEVIWLFAHLTNGRGQFDLGIEIRRFVPGKSLYVLGRSQVERRTFDHPLQVQEVVWKMRNVPFPTPGQYEFCVLARGQELQGGSALVDVLPGVTS